MTDAPKSFTYRSLPTAAEDAPAVQRWAVLAGSARTDDEDAELKALVAYLTARGHVLSGACDRHRKTR